MNEDNESNVEDLDEQQSSQSSTPRRRGLLNKGKKAGKNFLKNITEAFKGGLKQVWRALPPMAKIVLISVLLFILFCACAIVALTTDASAAAIDSVGSYIQMISESSGASSELKNFASTGSLLLLSDDDITKIANIFFEDVQYSNTTIYELMNQKYKNGDKDSKVELEDGAISLNEEKTLYEHLLNAERYNFNKIKWVKYTRGEEDGTPEMQVDPETRLQYPKDDQGTSLVTFANMVQPYLQNYIIPYSMYVGLITDGRVKEVSKDNEEEGVQFAYEMLNTTYHDIQVNQYNLESYTKITNETIYDVLEATVECTAVVNDSGTIISKSYKIKSHVTTESCVSESEDPVITTVVRPKYVLKSAKTYDKYIINEYKYTKYDLNNEPDDQTISRMVYTDENYDLYESGDYGFSNDDFDFEYDGKIRQRGSYTAEKIIKMKKGYTEIITSTWKDLIEQESHEERAYTVEDVEEEIGGSGLSSSEKEYYKIYEGNALEDGGLDRLTLVDLANAKKEVYSTYLNSGEEFSKNIGFHREWMTYSFYTLKQAIKKMEESDTGWKYFYGSSAGATEATMNVSSGVASASSGISGISVDYSNLPEGKLGWPSPGHTTISSYFGNREGGGHRGVDISMPAGSSFVAAASGTVVAATTNCTDNYGKSDALQRKVSEFCGGGAGNYVKIKVDNADMYIIYMHMTTVDVTVDQHVEAGQFIGTCGSTGRSTGDHAHFEVRVGGSTGEYAVDPLPLLQQ